MTTKTPNSLYALIITILLFCGSCSKNTTIPDPGKMTTDNSNIVYTNINPDSVILSASTPLYNLDLNNDGIIDFILTEAVRPATGCRMAAGTTYAGGIRPAGGNKNAVVYNGGVPRILDSLSPIDSNAYWTQDTVNKMLFSNTTGRAAACNPPGGPLNYTTYQYLGLKFIKDGKIYYGWARLLKIDVMLILKDYAYNSIAGKPILAGQTK